MQNNRKSALGVLIITALQVCSCSYAMDPTYEAIKLVYEASKKAGGEILQSVVGAGACADLAGNVYTIGKDVAAYTFPSNQEQADAEKIDQELKLMSLRKELRSCLMANRASKARGWLGIPSDCQAIAETFSHMGGRDEAYRMAGIFNVFNK